MKAKQSPMLVNTADASTGIITPIQYARTADGKIDLGAYKNKRGQIKENNLTINVKIVDARRRYGHLDLKVMPISGEGEVWVERKNISIEDDPALSQNAAPKKDKEVRISIPRTAKTAEAAKTTGIPAIEDLRTLIGKIIAEERANS